MINTTNGTDWNKCGNANIIYYTNEEAPLWLSPEDLRVMSKELEVGNEQS